MKRKHIKNLSYIVIILMIIAILVFVAFASFDILHGHNNGHQGQSKDECKICEIIDVLQKEIRVFSIALVFLTCVFISLRCLYYMCANPFLQLNTKSLFHQNIQLNN